MENNRLSLTIFLLNTKEDEIYSVNKLEYKRQNMKKFSPVIYAT